MVSEKRQPFRLPASPKLELVESEGGQLEIQHHSVLGRLATCHFFSILLLVMAEATAQPFAVIQTGGKQYKVAVGDVVMIEKLADDMEIGDKVAFDQVSLLDDGKTTTLGAPFIDGAKVQGVLEDQGKDKKISVIRFRSKSRYHRKYGHRQPYMKVKITSLK